MFVCFIPQNDNTKYKIQDNYEEQEPGMLAINAINAIENRLNSNIFDIRSLAPLKRVDHYEDLTEGKHYFAVDSLDGIPMNTWKTRFEYKFKVQDDSTAIVGLCTIMDGNFSFTRWFDTKNTIIYYCPDEDYSLSLNSGPPTKINQTQCADWNLRPQ